MENDTGINIEDLHRSDVVPAPSSSAISSSSGVAGEVIKAENIIVEGSNIDGDGIHERRNGEDRKDQDSNKNDGNYEIEDADIIVDNKESVSNNGRWTKSEHELFLRGMSLWGRDWKKVQSAVKVT